MPQESFSRPEVGEEEVRELDFTHAGIRELAKDLRHQIRQGSPLLARREELLEKIEEILAMVPARDEEVEARDERRRSLYGT